MILELIRQHTERYGQYTITERLKQLGMSRGDLGRLRGSKRKRQQRESAIAETDVEQIVEFIVEHPGVGAGRARLTLIDQERALASTAFINEAKHEVARLAEQHYRQREQQGKLLEAELRARRTAVPAYQHIHASYSHHIWAIDFVAIPFLSFRLAVCVVYDIFSQGYLAIQAGTGCDQELAQRSLEAAIAHAGCRAAAFMRRDNGKAFVTVPFQEVLADNRIEDAPIPPGQPWLNGSLESNNGSLKAALYSAALQGMASEPAVFRSARHDRDTALAQLQNICARVQTTLNDTISRPKFGMPPARAMNGEVDATRERHDRFIHSKKKERRRRMHKLRQQPDKPTTPKTFLGKVARFVNKRVRAMTTDQLYVLNEALHRRSQAVQI